MRAELLVPAAFASSLLTAVVLTPLAIRLAHRARFYDWPNGGYKAHTHPTPYLGGLAVLAAIATGAFVGGVLVSKLALIVALAAALWAVGTTDDRFGLPRSLRILSEAGAACALYAGGLGWQLTGGGALDLVLTIVWVVALANAANLMDNMDGAASAVMIGSSAGIAGLALTLGDAPAAALAVVVAGGCLGFLRYNLAGPARIFLGDGGSLPLGFTLAATVMVLPAHAQSGVQRVAAGALVVGLPLLDTALVAISRRRAGLSVMSPGRDHLSHRLRRRLGSEHAVALALGCGQAALSGVAFGLTRLGDRPVLVVVAAVATTVAATIALLASLRLAAARSPAASDDAHLRA